MLRFRRGLVISIIAPALAITSCSDRKPTQSAAADAARQAPDRQSQQPESQPVGSDLQNEPQADGVDTLAAEVNASGVPTKYVAHFEQSQLTRIEETHQPDGRRGTYEFHGARLLKYSGAAIRSANMLDLEFDLQGTVKSAQAESGSATDADVRAIRDRAQLLRSHALAQRSTRAHAVH